MSNLANVSAFGTNLLENCSKTAFKKTPKIGSVWGALPEQGAHETVVSRPRCFKQFFARGQLFTYSLEDLGNYYTDYIRAMNHWHNVYGKDIYTVHYDNVINETEETIRELIDYCELPFEKECLEFYNSSRPVKTPSAEQVRQPIYKSGLNYWKNYEKHLLPLKKIIDEID